VEQPFNTVNLFIMSEIQKERSVPPGRQYADDPLILLRVMQRTIQQHGNVNLTQQQIDRLYQHFQTEAQHFRQQYHQYVTPNAYDEVLPNIKAMLDRMKARG
jgi:phosphoglycolate phosphatase-like HAD superfamily hydrolase